MIEGGYHPNPIGVMGSADWESPDDSKRPPDKRHPYPGEIYFLEAEARRVAGRPRYAEQISAWNRKVSRLFYKLVLRRRIYIEGA